jgi:formylglycine-generating enzyme required for sulfatase activity
MLATEVTVGQFARYSAATAQPIPRQPDWNPETHPVVNVTWAEASAFCTWAGGRLPTEAEWEYAARGGEDAELYPWGPEFDPNMANGTGRQGRDQWDATAPGGSFPPNGFGLFDMIGNVWEWTADWYAEDYYAQAPVDNPTGPPSGLNRVIRGGSWDSEAPRLVVSFRWSLLATGRYNLYVGFRCARDARRP